MKNNLERGLSFGVKQKFGTVEKITYSPVKGARHIEVQSAELTPEGIKGDKEWVIVQASPDDEGIHKWVSQRDKRSKSDKPQSLGVLALIKPELTNDALHLTWDGSDRISVPRDKNKGKDLPVRIWDDVMPKGAVDQGDEVSKWLTDHLDFPVRLVKATDRFDRKVTGKWLPNQARIKGQDSYPLHWITRESLTDFDDRAGEKLSETRFRANIIIKDTPYPSSEHEVLYGTIGDVPFINAKPSDRCPVPMVDQQTGEKSLSGEPLKTLNTYKRWLRPDGKVNLIFGENSIPLGHGEISVGQDMEVVALRNPRLIFGGAEITPNR